MLLILVVATSQLCAADEPASPSEKLSLVMPLGHALPVNSVAFSADGKRAVTGSEDHTAIVWDAAAGRQLSTFADPGGTWITAVAISADGRYIATGSAQGAVVVWDTNTHKKVRTLVWHLEQITALAFRNQAGELLSASIDKSLVSWDVATGLKRQLCNTAAPILGAALSPDGSRAATVEDHGEVILWDLASGRRIKTMPGDPQAKSANEGVDGTDPRWPAGSFVAFSSDGKRLAAPLADKSVVICDALTGEKLLTFVGQEAAASCVAFCRDGKRVIAAAHTHADSEPDGVKVLVWDAGTGKQVGDWSVSGAIPVGVRPDGSQITLVAYGYRPGERQDADLRDAVTGAAAGSLRPSIDIHPAAISRDGRQMAIVYPQDPLGGSNAVVVQFNKTGANTLRLSNHVSDGGLSTSFSADGSTLATETIDKVNLVELQTGKRVVVSYELFFPPLPAVFSPDLKRFLSPTSTENGPIVRLMETGTGDILESFPLQGQGGCACAFSSDGKQVAVCSDTKVIVYDQATGKEIRAMEQTSAFATFSPALLFSPDGKRLAYATFGGLLNVWDVATGRQLVQVSGIHGGGNAALAFSPDGRKLATMDDREKPTLLDATSGQKLPVVLNGSTGPIFKFWFSPDGKLLAAIDHRAIVYWDAGTGEKRLTLMFFGGDPNWFAITPDGLFDGSEGGRQSIGVCVGDGMSVVPVQQAAKQFYRPGLVSAILSGEHPKAESGK